MEAVEELADIIMVLQRTFMAQLCSELTKGQVSFPQFFLLAHINIHDSLSMTGIAEKMCHTTAAATGLVDRLENLGYVQRMHAPTDRRKVLVTITEKGRELVGRIRQDIVGNLTGVMQTLEPDERHMWLQIYRKILNYCSENAIECQQ